AEPTLVAVVGDDERGRRLAALLEAHGVRCAFVYSDRVSTVHKLRVLARNQQLIRLDSEQPLAAAAGPLLPIFDSGLDAADVVVLSDYAKGTLAAAAQMIERCRHERRPVLIDPKGNDFARYTGATVLTPNQSEFSDVV